MPYFLKFRITLRVKVNSNTTFANYVCISNREEVASTGVYLFSSSNAYVAVKSGRGTFPSFLATFFACTRSAVRQPFTTRHS